MNKEDRKEGKEEREKGIRKKKDNGLNDKEKTRNPKCPLIYQEFSPGAHFA